MKALDVLNPNPRSTLSGNLIFQFIFRSKNVIFPSNKKSPNWIEITFQRNIWGQLDVRTRMRASKSRNSDLEKSILAGAKCTLISVFNRLKLVQLQRLRGNERIVFQDQDIVLIPEVRPNICSRKLNERLQQLKKSNPHREYSFWKKQVLSMRISFLFLFFCSIWSTA